MNDNRSQGQGSRRFAAACVVAGLCLLLLACPGRTRNLEDRSLTRKDLTEFGASLVFPSDWVVKRGEFFHLEARSSDENEPRALFEYRGLEKVKKGRESRRQYAAGWYRAIALSYEGWEYESRSTDPADPEGTWRFEGVYLEETPGSDGPVLLRKIGLLRFRGERVHALYYTALASDFDAVRPLFEKMDSLHRYFDPVDLAMMEASSRYLVVTGPDRSTPDNRAERLLEFASAYERL